MKVWPGPTFPRYRLPFCIIIALYGSVILTYEAPESTAKERSIAAETKTNSAFKITPVVISNMERRV